MNRPFIPLNPQSEPGARVEVKPALVQDVISASPLAQLVTSSYIYMSLIPGTTCACFKHNNFTLSVAPCCTNLNCLPNTVGDV